MAPRRHVACLMFAVSVAGCDRAQSDLPPMEIQNSAATQVQDGIRDDEEASHQFEAIETTDAVVDDVGGFTTDEKIEALIKRLPKRSWRLDKAATLKKLGIDETQLPRERPHHGAWIDGMCMGEWWQVSPSYRLIFHRAMQQPDEVSVSFQCFDKLH